MKKMRKYFLSTAVMTLVQAPTMARSIITAVLQFFSGAVSHTGFRTGYNSSHPGKNEVNSGSSYKLEMKSYNLCSQ